MDSKLTEELLPTHNPLKTTWCLHGYNNFDMHECSSCWSKTYFLLDIFIVPRSCVTVVSSFHTSRLLHTSPLPQHHIVSIFARFLRILVRSINLKSFGTLFILVLDVLLFSYCLISVFYLSDVVVVTYAQSH